MATCLHHDHGLQPSGRTQSAHEVARVADSLDIKEDALRLAVQGEVVEDIPEVDIRRRAERDHRGETDPPTLGPIDHRGTDGPGLGD
jgi:hypothetical protein